MFAFRSKAPRRSYEAAPDQSGIITVAVAMPMSGDERNAVGAALGASYRVVDICVAPLDTALVVVGPCSAGAIQNLTRTFPQAAVLVVERQSSTGGGPVTSALRAGAIAYIVAGPERNDLATPNAA